MVQRNILAIVLVAVGTTFSLAPAGVRAADAPPAAAPATAAQMLQKGLTQYKNGDLAGAKATLMRVDPAQLSKEQRVDLTRTLQDIDRQAAAMVDPVVQLDKGDKALDAGDLAAARDFYNKVLQNAAATPSQKDTAGARLVEVQRRMMAPPLAKALQNLNDADADLKAGNLDDADAKLMAVRDSKIDLGWFDNQRLDRDLKLVAELRAAAPKPAPMTTPPPAQPQTPPPAMPVATPVPPAPPTRDLLAEAALLAAQEKVAKAKAADAEGNYQLAVQLYSEAVLDSPNDPALKTALTAEQAKADSQQGQGGLLGEEQHNRDLVHQATVAEFRELMDHAEALRKSENYSAALEAIGQAKTLLDVHVQDIPSQEYQALRQSADAAYASINDQRINAESEAVVEGSRKANVIKNELEREAADKLRKEVDGLILRAMELRRTQQYEESEARLTQALFLDPGNVAAQAMLEMVKDQIIIQQVQAAYTVRNRNFAAIQGQNSEAEIPPTQILNYPTDWVDLTKRRLAGLNEHNGESEADRRIFAKLKEPIPIDFNANKLSNVIDYLHNITGINIFVNWTALNGIGIQQDTQVTLKLANIPAGQALKLVLQGVSAAAGAGATDVATYTVHDGLIKISTDTDIKTTTVFTRIYDIRDLTFIVQDFNAPASMALQVGTPVTAGGPAGSTPTAPTTPAQQSPFTTGATGGTSTVSDDKAALDAQTKSITNLIETTVGKKEDWPDFGGTLSSITNYNGTLIIRTTPESHRAIIELLDLLRETSTMQISYECRFLLVVRDFIDDFGVDVNVTLNKPGQNWIPLQIMQDSFTPAAVSNIGNLTIANPALSLATSFISVADELEVDILVNATQTDQRNVTLTAPRLTLMDAQRGNIVIQTQTAYVSDLTPIPDTGGFQTTVSVVGNGVQLDIRGAISPDRRYVTMQVLPQLTQLDSLVKVPVDTIENLNTQNVVANDNNNNSENNNNATQVVVGFIQLPVVENTTVDCTVSCPDKGTLLLGGQRIVTEVETQVGVPVLSKIPIINRLFQNTSKAKEDRTLLILIKPTIILQTEEEDLRFPGLSSNPETYDRGQRMQ